jgi:hypothetical protein
MNSPSFSIQVLGNVQTCRTEAEISFAGTAEPWAVVWEEASGWQSETFGPVPVSEALAEQAIEAARRRLSQYVNRRGENPPPGLSAAGLSLWLMAKADGTALGRLLP